MQQEEKKTLPGVEDKTQEFKDYKKGQRSFKGNRRSRRGARGVPTRGANDFAFWNQYPELMGIATRFPWMHIAGTPLKGPGVSTNLPNVAVQRYFSIPGTSKSATDPLNLAFRQMYLDMHRKYRGIGAYQASDIAITFICIESVLQLIVEAERIYGILNEYPVKSRIEPEGLLLAMGYNLSFITSIKTEMANYRYEVNRIIELAKRLPMPQGMSFFKNHVVLNGFVYKDSTDDRASLLVFKCDNYYHYSDGSDAAHSINSAGTAESKPIQRRAWLTYHDMFTLIESELTNLLTDSDILRITSDFIACYGENNTQVLTSLPEDYKCTPVYSESILHKWHNSERVAVDVSKEILNSQYDFMYRTFSASDTTTVTTGFCVYQRNASSGQDIVISAPTISVTDINNYAPAWHNADGGGKIYGDRGTAQLYPLTFARKGFVNDSWAAEPSQEQICESMLWKVLPYSAYDTGLLYTCVGIEECGTEILTVLTMSAVSNSAVVGTELYEDSDVSICSSNVDDGLIMFDWHPYIFQYGANSEITAIYGDVDNVTVVSKDVILKVLDAANLSAFKVTVSGSSN